jgi:DNA modification methylase
VLDAFAGSGTTIMAAEQLGRRAFCMEIDPRYADVAIRRWQAVTKRDAVLEATGQTFDQLSKGKVRAGAKSRRRK